MRSLLSIPSGKWLEFIDIADLIASSVKAIFLLTPNS